MAGERVYGSMFTGGDLAGVGLRAAGYRSGWGVESVAAIAEVAEANGCARVLRQLVQEVDYSRLERPDLLWASPVCKNASRAKTQRGPQIAGLARGETPEDVAMADGIIRALAVLTPPTFVLENVVGYRLFTSFKRIIATLDRLGYMCDVQHLNSADFGVPQTRVRLIVRAVRGGLVPLLPPPVPWVGWYAAIEDLLPSLPESKFAPWQLARLEPLFGDTLVPGGNASSIDVRDASEPARTVGDTQRVGNLPRAFLVHPTDQRSMPVRMEDEPVWTILANSYADSHASGPRPRAFLVSAQSQEGGAPTTRHDGEPAVTVGTNGANQRAFIVGDQHGAQGARVEGRGVANRDASDPTFTLDTRSAEKTRAWLEQGRVVSMTPRALGRFMSLPDSYSLPERRTLACTIIGNGVPCGLAEAIGRSLLGCV